MTTAPSFRLGSVALPVYLPGLLFSIGEGAVIPVIPVDAARLGGSLALAGFISALIMVGTLIGDIPSGWIVAKVGERTAMIGSAVAALAGLLLCILATVPAVLGLGVLLIGIATASFALARQAFMTTFVPASHRARGAPPPPPKLSPRHGPRASARRRGPGSVARRAPPCRTVL